MFGGSASAGGRWSLGAKTYRAPTEGERIREKQERLANEAERRKIHELKHQEKHIRKNRELQREEARAVARAVGMERGALGVYPSPRMRASSFSGIGSPGLYSLGSPAGLGAGLGVPPVGGIGLGGRLSPALSMGAGMGAGRARLRSMERGREAEIARVRAQTNMLEAEAARRERTASAMHRQRAELALANERILASPRLSPALHPMGVGGLGVPPLGGAGLRRTRSWNGALPHLGGSPLLGHRHHHSPHVVPVPVPVPVPSPHHHHHHLPSPRLFPTGGVGGIGIPGRVRTPSPGRLGYSPHLGHGHSPHITNYNTFHVSPRMGGVGGVGGGAYGDLGAMDDLALGAGAMGMVDPPLLDGGLGGGMGAMPGGFGGGGMSGMAHGFVVTDLDHQPGRVVVQDFGYVQGVSTGGAQLDEDVKLQLAIADLTSRAQSMGANGVLSVETLEDYAGEIVVRGRAVVLS
ncbi:hypothetical protein JCM8097_004257 [Rhodosporidiobolus ruineniae]